MKKILTVVLAALMLLSAVSLTACGKAEELKLGLGIYTYYEQATDADGDINGKGEVVATAAAVLLDAEGKIVQCVIDAAQNTVNYTSDGKSVAVDSFKSKYEKREEYGMKAYGTDNNGDGKVLEWYEQADAFAKLTVGKTIDEVKALMVEGGTGTDEVMTAGCTIAISDFVLAVEKAVANAAPSSATANDTLKLGVYSVQAESQDATEEAAGKSEVDTTFVAVAKDADGKVTACDMDALQATFSFDVKGIAATDVAAELKTKKELGDNYNMKAYGSDLNGDGVVGEWYEQAAVFTAACVGKTVTEIAALEAEDGYGVESLQTATCTIAVSDFVAAAVKAAQ